PAGNTNFIAIADPDTVPVTVPALNLWHDAHVPSAALSGARAAVPEIALPETVSIHDRRSGPCGSMPVPLHAPARPAVFAGGAGVVVVVGAVGAVGEGVLPPHPKAHEASAAAAAAPRAAEIMKPCG